MAQETETSSVSGESGLVLRKIWSVHSSYYSSTFHESPLFSPCSHILSPHLPNKSHVHGPHSACEVLTLYNRKLVPTLLAMKASGMTRAI
jgi:hypothetical protein